MLDVFGKDDMLECNESTFESSHDVNCGMVPYFKRTWKQTALHIAARNNAIEVVKVESHLINESSFV